MKARQVCLKTQHSRLYLSHQDKADQSTISWLKKKKKRYLVYTCLVYPTEPLRSLDPEPHIFQNIGLEMVELRLYHNNEEIQIHQQIGTLIYLYWCFTLYSRKFHLHHSGQHYGWRQSERPSAKPTSMHRGHIRLSYVIPREAEF